MNTITSTQQQTCARCRVLGEPTPDGLCDACHVVQYDLDQEAARRGYYTFTHGPSIIPLWTATCGIDPRYPDDC